METTARFVLALLMLCLITLGVWGFFVQQQDSQPYYQQSAQQYLRAHPDVGTSVSCSLSAWGGGVHYCVIMRGATPVRGLFCEVDGCLPLVGP